MKDLGKFLWTRPGSIKVMVSLAVRNKPSVGIGEGQVIRSSR